MGQFQVDKKQQGEEVVLEFSGQVDEDASFSGVEVSGGPTVTLDLEKISAINSCGIREWIKWVSSAPGETRLVFKNCPKIIVDQINMVAGFLPVNATVESFYVPYYSDESGEEKMILFKRGSEFNDGKVNPPEKR